MDLHNVINKEYGIRTGLALARVMPKSAGYHLARFLAGQISARRDQPMVKATRMHQAVAHGGKLTEEELDGAVRRCFENRAYAIFDLYHSLQRPTRMLEAVDFAPEIMELIEESKQRKLGTLVVSGHISNIELVSLAAAQRGGKGVALTLPEQPGGYKIHDELRRRFGIEAMPASMASYKYALQILGEGGTIVTGVDRPLPSSKYRPHLFGRETALPVHHIALALRAKLPITVVLVSRRADGTYKVDFADSVPMRQYADRKTEIVANAERILEICEAHIAAIPEQWAMFFPLWPNGVPEVSG